MSELRTKMIQQMQLKGYSESTITSYIESIALISRHYKCPADLLSIEQIRDYILNGINERKLSRAWLNQLVSAIKILFCQVLKREWNALEIPRPRRVKKLPVILSRAEVQKIFESLRNLKHRSIMMLIYSAGLRMGELRSLRIQDIDSDRMQIHIRQAKGFKDRYAVLSTVALEELRVYYKICRPQQWLFETKQGQQISERQIQWIFKSALKKAEIAKEATVHTLRHSFATHMMETGVSLPIIQQLLGHKSLRTTSVYLHVQKYSLESVKSPLDSF